MVLYPSGPLYKNAAWPFKWGLLIFYKNLILEKSWFNSIWFYYSYRPWYIASATPHPKDVVLLVKNNLFPQDSVRARQYEAADVILRTLNPKDKVIFDQTHGGGSFSCGPVLFYYTLLNTLVYKNKQHTTVTQIWSNMQVWHYRGKGPKLKVYLGPEFLITFNAWSKLAQQWVVCVGNTSWAN